MGDEPRSHCRTWHNGSNTYKVASKYILEVFTAVTHKLNVLATL
jgi:hypothetical protein